jgi:hypothetical protein
MTIKIPISIPPVHLDSSSMHNRKEVKREHLHRIHQEKVEDFFHVKKNDFEVNKSDIRHWNLKKDIEEINNYLSLKKQIEYGLYRYSISLGTNLDVYV